MKLELKNKKAKFKYEFIETYTAGIKLVGTEIKSIRDSKVSFTDSYCFFIENELWLRNVHISEYENGNINNHDPIRDRKLLLNRSELNKLEQKSAEKGLTIVPVKIFINDKNLAKVEIALAKGKNISDKRQTIKKRDIERQMKNEL
jgi:SsrA-binding protein